MSFPSSSKELKTNIQQLKDEYDNLLQGRAKTIADRDQGIANGTLNQEQVDEINKILSEVDKDIETMVSKFPIFSVSSGFWNQATNIEGSYKTSFTSTNSISSGNHVIKFSPFYVVAAATARSTNVASKIRILGKRSRRVIFEKNYSENGIFTDKEGLIGGLLGGLGGLVLLPIAVGGTALAAVAGLATAAVTGGASIPLAIGSAAASLAITAAGAGVISATAIGGVAALGTLGAIAIASVVLALSAAVGLAALVTGGTLGIVSLLTDRDPNLSGFKKNAGTFGVDKEIVENIFVSETEPLVFEITTSSTTSIMSTYADTGMVFNISSLENIYQDVTEDANFTLSSLQDLEIGQQLNFYARDFNISGPAIDTKKIGSILGTGNYTFSFRNGLLAYKLAVGSLRFIGFELNVYLAKPLDQSFNRQLITKLSAGDTFGFFYEERSGTLSDGKNYEFSISDEDLYSFEFDFIVDSTVVGTLDIAADAWLEFVMQVKPVQKVGARIQQNYPLQNGLFRKIISFSGNGGY